MSKELIRYDYEEKPLRSREFHRQEREHMQRIKKATLIDKMFPGADLVSWSTTAGLIWCWLAYGRIEDTHKAGLMPTLVVDRRDMPRQINKVNHNESLMHGENLWSFSYLGGTDDPYQLCSQRSEIRVYHRSLMRLIKQYWHGRAPIMVYKTLIAHALIHEMMHYVTLSKLWAAQFEDNVDEDEAYDKLVHQIFGGIGSAEDEFQNEKITLAVLKRLMLTGMDGPCGDGNLLPALGGRYDLWKREKDEDYRARMDAYEVAATLLGAYYLDYAGLDRTIDWDDRFWDIVTRQEKEARRNHEHVIVVD